MNMIGEFGIDSIKKDDNQVIFFMEDTFELWLLDFEIDYTLNHFADGSLDQIIISANDYLKIMKHF